MLDDYVIEGRLEVNPIHKFLRERSAIKGISLPGMSLGATLVQEVAGRLGVGLKEIR